MTVSRDDLLSAASWITSATTVPLPIFRRVFRVEHVPRRASVSICGLGHFELRVNGRKAGPEIMEPGWTDYRKTCLVVTRDVTSLLQPGENVLGIMLGNGMFNVVGGRYAKFKGSFGTPRCIVLLRIEHSDGRVTLLGSDPTWKTAPGPITFSCIYGGEDHDARLEPVGWDRPGFDDTSWDDAMTCDGPGGCLVELPIPPIRAIETRRAVDCRDVAPGVRVFDLGQNLSGRPVLRIRGRAGARVTLLPGELLDGNGRVTQKNIGQPTSFTYTARGDGVETWTARFSYTGFRYLQVEGELDGIESVGAEWTHADARVVGSFRCSSEPFNRIHAMVVAAMRSNMQSVLTDCPHREKLGWLEQTHLMGPSLLCNFDLASLYAKISRDMRDAQRDDGMVPTIAPRYTSFKPPWEVFNDSPEWGSAIVQNPWLVYRFTGRRELIDENYDAMARYIAYLDARSQNGILAYGLGDWYDVGEGRPGFSKLTSPGLTATAIYFDDLRVMQRCAALLGRTGEARGFEARAEQVRRALNARFFDPLRCCYDTASQTACAMPLALGLVESRHRGPVLRKLIDDIRDHDNHFTAGDVGLRYVLLALAGAGRSDVISDVLLQTDAPSYGAQLARGATTLTEAWDADPNSSQNHLMLGHVEEWFFEHLAGLGFDASRIDGAALRIAPAFVPQLDWVEATRTTPEGDARMRWERRDARIRLFATVPCHAELIGPDGGMRPLPAGSHELEWS